MVFSSIIFLLFFLPVFLAAYYVVPPKGTTNACWLDCRWMYTGASMKR